MARLDYVVHHLGLALGGRPAASFARRLMVPVSNDTLLRVVRRQSRSPSGPLTVIGIDDWAWRRNQRYGTIVCDLERQRPVTLLPDREPATTAAWLEQHREIAVIARDRGCGYGEAAARALPHAVQVADRWHLMENASRAFLDAVRKSMRQIRTAIGAATIDPRLLTAAAERIQYEGYLRRVPSARTIARLMTTGRDMLSKADTITIAAIEDGVPRLVEARETIAMFHAMVRKTLPADLATWIARARTSLVSSFANGVAKDEAAVRAAITLPWSNGQTEGQITKLKLVKRQMYGRGKIDLLQARLIGAA